MAYEPFVPLRVFSAYTMLEGAIEPKAIAKTAHARGFPAIALADRNGLYAGMQFADGCMESGIQPIVGTLLCVARPDVAGSAPVLDWLALYAQNPQGYDNLCDLVSHAHLDRPLELPAHVPFERLEGRTEGVIALTAGGEGALVRLLAAGQADAAEAYCDRLQSLFGDRLYIELCRRGEEIETLAETALLDLAYARGLPIVATNPACYSDPGFHAAHDAMLCIARGEYVGAANRVRSSPEAWIKSAPMMRELFSDLPEALVNTIVVAQRCAFAPPKRKPILPSLAGDLEGEAAQLRADAFAGLEMRLSTYTDQSEEERKVYFARLEFEVNVIVGMGFPGYFLIVADFIKWAKDHNIPVGPGRGSGAGSVVAWALTITDLDPLKLGLLFERFLNPERVSMPDFDIDFCETRRGEVIRYVQAKYGRDHVAQIITFGKLKARAVLRDTGRVLQMGYGRIDGLCKLVPNHPTDPWKLDRALAGVDELRQQYRDDAEVKRLFDLAMQLEGLPRHSSTHAAGVVIGDRPLAQLVPLYRDPRSDMPVTQFDMKYVEIAGLVKFDFLGLKTLSVLHKATEMLARRGITVDLSTLPWDDAGVYELLKRGDTVGVFQLESEGMRRTLAQVKPTAFGDIIALVSLYRPGPMDNIPSFGARKNGRETITYPHPLLEDILKETYGIIVYQEQVMQAAQVLAGYSLGDADLLRRAMGKKIKAEMDQQRGRFVEGAGRNNIDSKKANELFDLIDKFAGYGFNKSHAAAYALLAYQTAWLKAHYPHEFFAASMCFDMHQSEKLNIFVDDMRRMGVACLPPCINASEAEFSVEETADGLAVRYALAGLKNVGEKAMDAVVASRVAGGAFASLGEFADRVDAGLVNKRQIESLAAAGAFDGFEIERSAVYGGADMVLAVAAEAHRQRTSGQGGLFGDVQQPGQSLRLPASKPWAMGERMTRERDAFGFFFSAHPVTEFEATARSQGARPYQQVVETMDVRVGERKTVKVAALVEGCNRRQSKRGNAFVMVDLSDESGQFSASSFDDDIVAAMPEWASQSACLLIELEFDRSSEDQAPRATIRRAQPLDQIKVTLRHRASIDVLRPEALTQLSQLVGDPGGGQDELHARLIMGKGRVMPVKLGNRFRLDAKTIEALRALDGIAVRHVESFASQRPELRLVS
ncbi:DNA polymerase III subunit alpha [Blastomonas sp.]|uniref:DNA polymerase III subunit alpha n=1 Tax=Blastomonas sp. TaxID=1909299 RepID=UPI00391AACD1